MVNRCPQLNPKGKYGRAKTAKILGIHATTLDRYTIQGHIALGGIGVNNRKFYFGSAIMHCWHRLV